jgi:superfamily II DNA or RNA helicase
VASTYLEILEHFGGMPDCTCANRDPEGCWDCRNTGWTQQPTPVLGVTATLARSDGQGLGGVWQDVAFTRSLAWGIRHGYLIDLVPYTIKIPGVDAGASDAALDAMLADSIAPEAVVRAWMQNRNGPGGEHGGAPSTVLFAPLVRSAEAFAAAFNDAGIKAEVVHGKLAPAERKAILDRYEQGITTVVCNAMVLTEGWDSPRTMCVIVARPTQSVPLFTQMVGRGVRPWLGADAPSREDQRCVLLCVAGATNELATIADLSDGFGGEAQDGKSLMQMEDEWDLGKDIEPDEDRAYRGPVVVERWDAAVRASTKAWKYTDGGVPFLPTAKRGEGYVFVVETARGCEVYVRYPAAPEHRGFWTNLVTIAPDLELAMALAEDEAQERGGDIGRLLADKGRAWRKAVPSDDMVAMARRAGINVVPVMQDKRAGKAGRLSDMIDKAMASRVLDGIATKIRERASDE